MTVRQDCEEVDCLFDGDNIESLILRKGVPGRDCPDVLKVTKKDDPRIHFANGMV